MMFQEKINIVVKRITENHDPKAIIVFGSVAKGTSDEDSGLDIAVIMDTELSEHDRNVTIRTCVGPIGMAIDILVFTPEEASSEKENRYSIISAIMREGEVVYGSA